MVGFWYHLSSFVYIGQAISRPSKRNAGPSTAGSAGLGAATARALASNGVRVVIKYHSNQEKADNVLKELERFNPSTDIQPPRYHAIKADVSQRAELIRLVKQTTAGRESETSLI